MQNKSYILSLLLAITFFMGCKQSNVSAPLISHTSDHLIGFTQIKSDTIFNSHQVISLLTISNDNLSKLRIQFGYSPSDLRKTSTFAESKNALAAINGGFFNMDDGGSATYFEINDTVINHSRAPALKWGIKPTIVNGAIIITKAFEIIIQPANSEQFYESSKQESAVLITGPLLLLNSEAMKLPNIKFSNKRHPRTCLCKKKASLVFITIDGRQKEAEGMSLKEVQKFLQSIGCIDAINLDGGGSTTMWTKKQGVVSFPSDKSGERPVANVILIGKKDH